jgi:hypothetical protein
VIRCRHDAILSIGMNNGLPTTRRATAFDSLAVRSSDHEMLLSLRDAHHAGE